MKRLLLFIFVLFLCETGMHAQRFEKYVKHSTDSIDRVYRLYKIGLKVLDADGIELRRTEPIYSYAVFAEGFDRSAVCVPIISLESGNSTGFDWSRVWICLDSNLKPVFIFPENTYVVSRVVNGMFLYKDKGDHFTTTGLVDADGKIIFEAPYERIYITDNDYIGVKRIADYTDTSGLETWSIEFKNQYVDSSHVLMLKTPKEESAGLRYGSGEFWVDWDWDKDDDKWFEEMLDADSFQRGLNCIVRCRIEESKQCFREAMQSDNPDIVRCAEYNLSQLNGLSFLPF